VAKLINDKIVQMGDVTYNEKMVGATFWILVLLWFFRYSLKYPQISDWAEKVRQGKRV
jgi:hypothetical protein